MRKFQILLTVLLLVLSGCAGGSRLDSSGVQVAWLENTRSTEPPPTMPTPPAETAPVKSPQAPRPEETCIPENTEAPTEAPAEAPTEAPTEAPAKAPAQERPVSPRSTAQQSGGAAGTLNPTTLTFSNGTDVDCLLYTPEAPSGCPGLIVYLHGGSGKGSDLRLITQADGFPQYLQSGSLGSLSCYVLIPQLPSAYKGWADMDDTLMDMIQALVREYDIDTANISLTGHSMGGTGAWAIAAAHPGYFARVAPLSGSIRNTPENLQAFANTRVYAFVGTGDTIVKPQATRDFVSALMEAGYDAKLTELPETDHSGVPSQAYLGDYGLVDWLEGK